MITSQSRVAIICVAALANAVASGAAPLPNAHAHAHNDYLHARPLLDALDHGFTSVEADVFPVAGNLYVGHDLISLKPERTLETLYLAPLADRVRRNGDHVYPTSSRFFLLIDFKGDPKETYRTLQVLLSKYNKMFSVVQDGKLREGAITVVLTGNRPKLELDDPHPRYVGLDGRLSDLDRQTPAHFMPMISDKWPAHFHWDGNGPMPASERARLQEIVKNAHAAGRVVRFWSTPENEAVWRELRSAGVDLINTDQLDRLAKFLSTPDTQPKHR